MNRLFNARLGERVIVCVQNPVVEVFRDPAAEGYRHVHRLGRGERVAPVALAGVEFSVDEILG